MDTESDPETKEPISIQTAYTGHYETIKDFNHVERVKALWNNAEAVILYNAPYDMGVLSSVYDNSYKWDGNFWKMSLFGCNYKVKRINGHRNIVRSFNRSGTGIKSVPVIDLLKLWSILVDESNISLKALIKREFGAEPIPWSKENALSREYQLQDVIWLEKLWYRFLERVSSIEAVRGYDYAQWSHITTPATFTKIAYALRYPDMPIWRKLNDKSDALMHLDNALEDAYHGGITISFYRGTIEQTAWYDIHGAYAHVIEYENTDQYMLYNWVKVDNDIQRDNHPYLCQVFSNVIFATINKSLKIYRLKSPKTTWMWSYDILAIREMFDADIKIIQMYKPIPLNHVKSSLSKKWSELKEIEQKEHGKTTLRNYYKFLSNTSYGIKAQRNPYRTNHTNMVIAGIITSRAHLILADMILKTRAHGGKWLYSDTDSISVCGIDCPFEVLETEINEAIYPYSVECEFVGKTRFLSLKRYIATNGNTKQDKIRLHGKSIYRIGESDMLRMLTKGPARKPIMIGGVSGNTERTFKQVLKINPYITHPHPFMFEVNIPTGLSERSWFERWYAHIDTKTTIPERALCDDEFVRDIRIFDTNYDAIRFYRGISSDEPETDKAYRDYDEELKTIEKVTEL